MISQDELKKNVSYDIETGIFKRKIAMSSKVKVGDVAGSLGKTGYLTFYVNSVRYKAHRLAWLYVYGEFPHGQIDHINCIKTDNRICNLRQASNVENCRNVGISNKNKSGYKGVSFHKESGKWRAICYLNGIKHSLGLHSNSNQASLVYKEFVNKNHGEFTHKDLML